MMDNREEKKNISPETAEVRRLSSIRRSLSRVMLKNSLGEIIFREVLVFFSLVFAWIVGVEMSSGTWMLADRKRELIIVENSLHYRVHGTEGFLVDLTVDTLLRTTGIILLIFFIIQLISLFFSIFSGNRQIDAILRPINEMAIKADALSRVSFSEEKYRQIEDAIDGIRPDEDGHLSLADEDLQGVEAAMNNLLKRVHEAYREQSRFVDDASHELRTPIAVIQGYASLLSRWGREDEQVLDESIEAIMTESDHMNHLVEQLLFLARGDNGRTALNKEKTDLSAMLQELYEESCMIDSAHHYSIQNSGVPTFMQVDPGLMKQAVRILIDNSAKYTKEGDDILLSCSLDADGTVRISVEDTGIGIASSDMAHIFERFYRSDEARSCGGSGLGLSISKWIIERHGGHFEVLSRTGIGTRITIVLPAAEAEEI